MATHSPWSTSSDGQDAETTPMDLATLGEHKAQCSSASGLWVALRCAAGQLLGLASRRLVTTAALCAALIGAVLIWL
jgi:hypothetical protein